MRIVQRNQHARELVAEAESGLSARRDGLRFFFQALDPALQLMYDEQVAGIPTSPHQKTLPEFLEIVSNWCVRLDGMRRTRKLVLTPSDCGFFASFLSVLDVLVMAPADVEIEVDWRLSGKEQHFTYATQDPKDCVWGSIFQPLHRPSAVSDGRALEGAQTVPGVRFNCFGISRYRWLSRYSPHARAQRAVYHAAYARWVQPRHPRLKQALVRQQELNRRHSRARTDPGTSSEPGSARRTHMRVCMHMRSARRTDAPCCLRPHVRIPV